MSNEQNQAKDLNTLLDEALKAGGKAQISKEEYYFLSLQVNMIYTALLVQYPVHQQVLKVCERLMSQAVHTALRIDSELKARFEVLNESDDYAVPVKTNAELIEEIKKAKDNSSPELWKVEDRLSEYKRNNEKGTEMKSLAWQYSYIEKAKMINAERVIKGILRIGNKKIDDNYRI